MDKETKEYVDRSNETMGARLREELKSHIQDNCQQHTRQMERVQNEVAQQLSKHSITLVKLTSHIEHDRSLLGQKIDNLTEVTSKLLQTVDGNGKGSLTTRIMLQEQKNTDMGKQLETIWAKLDGKRAIWTNIAIQSVPVLLTWAGFLVFWFVYHMSQQTPPPGITP